MKWYILTDLEGAWGVNRWTQTRTDGHDPDKREAMRFLTVEVNAVVDGLLDADPGGEVLVWDGHGNGGLDLSLFTPRAELIARGSGVKAPYGLDESFAGQLFVGQHAMAGTPRAPLCHTYSSKTVEWYMLNGTEIGEFGCRAYMAGALGVPTVFVAGDDAAVREAQALVPEIASVTTKYGLGVELARHRPRATVYAELRGEAARAVGLAGRLEPPTLAPPYVLRSRVLPDCSPDGYLSWPVSVRRLDERTVEAVSDDLTALWI